MRRSTTSIGAKAGRGVQGSVDRISLKGNARSMGAEDTVLYQKVSSERGVVPALDNRSTPRDMATMMQQIAEGKAASEKSCGYMIDLMHENGLDCSGVRIGRQGSRRHGGTRRAARKSDRGSGTDPGRRPRW